MSLLHTILFSNNQLASAAVHAIVAVSTAVGSVMQYRRKSRAFIRFFFLDIKSAVLVMTEAARVCMCVCRANHV